MDDGLEGWIQTQYLVDEPIAADRLERARQQLITLEAEHQQTLLRVQELEDEKATLIAAQSELQAAYSTTAEELADLTALSADVLRVQDENVALQSERESLDQQIDSLLIANDELQDDAAQEWFLRGGAVVIIALVLGFWFARRIYHRASSTWH